MGAPVLAGSSTIWRNSKLVRNTILAPFMSCASHNSCIRPPGARGFRVNNLTDSTESVSVVCKADLCHDHRGDQSALSAIMFDASGRQLQKSNNHLIAEVPYINETMRKYMTMHRFLVGKSESDYGRRRRGRLERIVEEGVHPYK